MTNHEAALYFKKILAQLEERYLPLKAEADPRMWESIEEEMNLYKAAISALTPVWFPMSRKPEPGMDRPFDGWLYWVQLRPLLEDPQMRFRYDIWCWMGEFWERALSDDSILEEEDLAEAVSYTPVIAPEAPQ